MTEKMVLFFIQRFNDIDHLSPIIFKIAKETEKRILVLAINPFVDIHNDFRIRFLKSEPNVTVDYFISYFVPSLAYKIADFILVKPYIDGNFSSNMKLIFSALRSRETQKFFFFLSRLISGTLRRLFSRLKIYQNLLIKLYDEKWVNAFISSNYPSIIVFDHASTSSKKNAIADCPPIKWVIKNAKENEIPIVSVPHGVPLFLISPDVYDERKKWIAGDKADYIVLQHKWWLEECVEAGLDRNKTALLGLARFCREWIKILHEIVPKYEKFKYSGSDKIKIVYMETGPDNYNTKKIHAQKMLNNLSKLDFVHLMYKPHTRSNKNHLITNDLIDNAVDINSVNLVKWADVVIGMHSSIMIEALIQNKIYISPRYFRDFELIHEKYEACFIADTYDDIAGALNRLKNDRNSLLYSPKNVEKFLIDVVNNGLKDADVLGDYKRFILEHAD